MLVNDPIGDMLTRIRNGQKARHEKVAAPDSRFRRGVLDALKREGYIRGYTVHDVRPGIRQLSIELKYHENEAGISYIKRLSTPGRRAYSGIKDLSKVRNGLGISILSTSRGILSDLEAREMNVGGEVLCEVF